MDSLQHRYDGSHLCSWCDGEYISVEMYCTTLIPGFYCNNYLLLKFHILYWRLAYFLVIYNRICRRNSILLAKSFGLIVIKKLSSIFIQIFDFLNLYLAFNCRFFLAFIGVVILPIFYILISRKIFSIFNSFRLRLYNISLILLDIKIHLIFFIVKNCKKGGKLFNFCLNSIYPTLGIEQYFTWRVIVILSQIKILKIVFLYIVIALFFFTEFHRAVVVSSLYDFNVKLSEFISVIKTYIKPLDSSKGLLGIINGPAFILVISAVLFLVLYSRKYKIRKAITRINDQNLNDAIITNIELLHWLNNNLYTFSKRIDSRIDIIYTEQEKDNRTKELYEAWKLENIINNLFNDAYISTNYIYFASVHPIFNMYVQLEKLKSDALIRDKLLIKNKRSNSEENINNIQDVIDAMKLLYILFLGEKALKKVLFASNKVQFITRFMERIVR